MELAATMKHFLAIAFVLGLGQVPIPKDNAHVVVLFSPRGGCTSALVDRIDHADKSVLVLSYTFTSKPIAAAITRAQARGLAVEIILDKSMRKSRDSQGDYCSASGVPVLYDSSHAIAHNKIVIIDGKIVIGGSFNHSSSAEVRNAENMTIITSPEIARQYLDDYRRHLDHSD